MLLLPVLLPVDAAVTCIVAVAHGHCRRRPSWSPSVFLLMRTTNPRFAFLLSLSLLLWLLYVVIVIIVIMTVCCHRDCCVFIVVVIVIVVCHRQGD